MYYATLQPVFAGKRKTAEYEMISAKVKVKLSLCHEDVDV
jgi:hypothetical protein